jgi:hypothetical protein
MDEGKFLLNGVAESYRKQERKTCGLKKRMAPSEKEKASKLIK